MLELVLSLMLAAVPPQQTPESKPVPKDSIEIESRGCLKGRVFTGTPMPEDERTRRGPDVTGRHFRVSGPRALMDLVKRYNGALVQVVGIVRKSALEDEGLGMKVGGHTRVVIGAPGGDPSRMNARTTVPAMAVLDLVAIRSLSDRCPLQ